MLLFVDGPARCEGNSRGADGMACLEPGVSLARGLQRSILSSVAIHVAIPEGICSYFVLTRAESQELALVIQNIAGFSVRMALMADAEPWSLAWRAITRIPKSE
jgi:hypothetical protein